MCRTRMSCMVVMRWRPFCDALIVVDHVGGSPALALTSHALLPHAFTA